MPPMIHESDAEESADEELPIRTAKEQVKAELADAVDDGEQQNGNEKDSEEGDEDEDDDEDDSAEVYVVDQILSHSFDFPDGECRYQVKWQGYDAKKDRTWELESNVDGARELLLDYFNSIGGRPVKGDPPAKKRGRQSTGKSNTPDTASKRTRTARSSTGAGSRKKHVGKDQSEDLDIPDVDPDWSPPASGPSTWENDVLSVETIEGDDETDEMWAYLLWTAKGKDGNWIRTRAKLKTCYLCCPQRMLHFYESHLVFTPRGAERPKPNGNGA